MKQFVLDFLVKEAGKVHPMTSYQPESGDADLHIRLRTGQTVAVYVLNRVARQKQLLQRFNDHTAEKVYPLFIVDQRMMPKEGIGIEPPLWMLTLHTLTNGRIYVYWNKGRGVTIRPVHLKWKHGTKVRHVEYGEPIDISKLQAQTIQCTSEYVVGSFTTASFGEGTFWRKTDPAQDRPYSHPWRQWTYNAPRQEEEPEPQEQPDWDAWEEFDKHYGKVGSDRYYRSRAKERRHGPEPKPRRTQSAWNRHYAILGVSSSASFDEIKQAYRRKARENHPDLHPDKKDYYTAKMADINAAFEAITKSRK